MLQKWYKNPGISGFNGYRLMLLISTTCDWWAFNAGGNWSESDFMLLQTTLVRRSAVFLQTALVRRRPFPVFYMLLGWHKMHGRPIPRHPHPANKSPAKTWNPPTKEQSSFKPEITSIYRGYPAKRALSAMVGPFWQDTIDISKSDIHMFYLSDRSGSILAENESKYKIRFI